MKTDLLTKTALAMVCITAIEIVAMLQHIDGAMLSLALAALSGLGGFSIGKYLKR